MRWKINLDIDRHTQTNKDSDRQKIAREKETQIDKEKWYSSIYKNREIDR